jgi:hypothetical protein
MYVAIKAIKLCQILVRSRSVYFEWVLKISNSSRPFPTTAIPIGWRNSAKVKLNNLVIISRNLWQKVINQPNQWGELPESWLLPPS